MMDGIYWTRGARQRVWSAYRSLLAASAVPLQEIRVATRSGETFVLACGSMQSPPVVLLHGGNTNSAMWLRCLPVWSQLFRVYAVDIVGDPGFSATTRLRVDTDDHALWLEDVFTALNLQRAAVVGASFGGWVALQFALSRPSTVDRLVLLAPAGIVRASIAATLEISALMLMGAWGRRRALLRLFGLGSTKITDDQESFMAFAGVVQRNALSRLQVPARIPDAVLRDLPVPALVVLGGRDIIFDYDAMAARLRKVCPIASVHTLPDAGHGLEDPTDMVRSFLCGSASG
jgi:pimeloyl-ACP methyl ester carboxylesterase